jgi:ribosomal protein L29
MLRRLRGLLPRRGLEEFQDRSADVRARPWLAQELRIKSFEDLHKLWYVLLKEKNMLLSLKHEAKRTGQEVPNFGRLKMVKISMARLKGVVGERTRAYNAAHAVSAEAVAEEPAPESPRPQSLRKSRLPKQIAVVRNVSKPLNARGRKRVAQAIKAAKKFHE